MIKRSSRRKYRRLLIFYSLVIILPGTSLGILAYRGINSNRIAEKTISDNRLIRKSKYFFGSIEESVNNYLEVFNDDVIIHNTYYLSLENDSIAQDLIERDVVLNVTYKDPDGNIKLLDRTTLFVPDDFWERSYLSEINLHKLVDAQSQEIIHQNSDGAMDNYRELLVNEEDPILQLQTLAGMARVYREKEQFDKALWIYRKIETLSNNEKLVYLIPDEIRKYFRMNCYHEDFHDSDANISLINRIKSLESLSFIGLPQICLTKSEYMILYQEVMELLTVGKDEFLDQEICVICDSLVSGIRRAMSRNNMLCNLYKSIEMSLENAQGNRRYSISYLPGIQDTISTLFSSKVGKDNSLGLLINTRGIIEQNFGTLSDTISFPKRIAWRITDYKDQVIKQSNHFEPTTNILELQLFPFSFGELHLHEVSGGQFELLSEAGQLTYFLLFVFVLVAMVIGLLLAIRSLTAQYRLSLMKSDFVSTVSHEFKSPLTSIRMMTERLAEKKVGSEERKQEYYASMQKQSERLSHLVENILDFSRLDAGRKTFHFEPTNLTRQIGEVVEYLSIRNSDSGFSIEFQTSSESIFGIVDSQGVHQVAFNLIDNAVKYSGDSRLIEVSLGQTDEYIILMIRDYGIGVGKREKRRIFSRFYRSERVNVGSIKGSGIGLSIVREIVKAHHGRIELESEINKGSVFRVYLPVNQKPS